MKIGLMLSLTLLVACSEKVFAQGQQTCGIWYEYDLVGNRIVRYYDCKRNDRPEDPPAESSIGLKTHPNTQDAGLTADAQAAENSKKQPFPTAGDLNNKLVTVYPNPMVDAFHIALQWMPSKTLHFHWYNAQGALVGSGNFTGSSYEGKTVNWADGSYWLYLYEGEKTIGSWKIIKMTAK